MSGVPMPSSRIVVVVQPRSRTEAVAVVGEKTLRVRVNAPPEGGKANAAVQSLLAKALRVPKGRVLIVAGEHTRKKIVVVPLVWEEAAGRLTGL